jgi:hypothetical protein
MISIQAIVSQIVVNRTNYDLSVHSNGPFLLMPNASTVSHACPCLMRTVRKIQDYQILVLGSCDI